MSDVLNKSKKFFLNLLIGILIFFIIPLIAIGIGEINTVAAMSFAGLALLIALISFKKRILFLNKFTGSTLLVAGLIALAVGFAADQTKKDDELLALKMNNPEAYLAKIKEEKGQEQWLLELKSLFPEQYEEEIAKQEEAERQRLAKLEAEKQSKIAALVEEVSKVPASDFAENLRLYRKLAFLDPSNVLYFDKVAFYVKKENEVRDMKRYPERFVTIISVNWWKDGFGSIMMANFTIKNKLPGTIKDMTITCSHSAPSGTVIDSNERTLFERLGSQETRTYKDVNMGFINEQAVRTGCRVTNVVPLF